MKEWKHDFPLLLIVTIGLGILGFTLGILIGTDVSWVEGTTELASWVSAVASVLVCICAVLALWTYKWGYKHQKHSELMGELIEADIQKVSQDVQRLALSMYIPLSSLESEYLKLKVEVEPLWGSYKEVKADWNKIIVIVNKLGGELDHENWKEFHHSVGFFMEMARTLVTICSFTTEKGGIVGVGGSIYKEFKKTYFNNEMPRSFIDENENGDVRKYMKILEEKEKVLSEFVIEEHKKSYR